MKQLQIQHLSASPLHNRCLNVLQPKQKLLDERTKNHIVLQADSDHIPPIREVSSWPRTVSSGVPGR